MDAEFYTTDCPDGERIISYMYGESAPDEAAAFETHLGSCLKCRDEFAYIAVARFSVYEWNRDEFAHMATPAFEHREWAAVPASRGGWLSGLAGFLWTAPRWAQAAAGVAVLAAGAAVASYNLPATDVASVAIPTVEQLQPADSRIVTVPPRAPDRVNAKTGSAPKLKEVEYRVRAQAPRLQRSVRASTVATRRPAPRGNEPRLSNTYQDDTDTTLRLADLFAELESDK
jgi:hypothetical protein